MTGSAQAQQYNTMHQRPQQRGRRRSSITDRLSFITALLLSSQVPRASAVVYPSNHELYAFDYLGPNRQEFGTSRTLTKRDNPIPLIVTNNCGETLWPGIRTQGGDPPDSHGFELGPGETKRQTVGPTWQGRIWGRTNCTTSGDTATCTTGDCFGKLDCEYGVSLEYRYLVNVVSAANSWIGCSACYTGRIQPCRWCHWQADLLRHFTCRWLQSAYRRSLPPGRQHLVHPAQPSQPFLHRDGRVPRGLQ